MRVIALLLPPRYQLFSEATPRKIVDTEGTIKVLLSEYGDIGGIVDHYCLNILLITINEVYMIVINIYKQM
jgi:hypothetical protein